MWKLPSNESRRLLSNPIVGAQIGWQVVAYSSAGYIGKRELHQEPDGLHSKQRQIMLQDSEFRFTETLRSRDPSLRSRPAKHGYP
jgi:hypothetical protein